MARYIKVDLDANRDNFILKKCKQNDNLELTANIFEYGSPIDLTTYVVGINGLRADKKFAIQNTEIVKTGNQIVAQLEKDFTRSPGMTLIEIILKDNNDKFNTTFNIRLEVHPSVTHNAVAESDNTVTIIEDLQNKTLDASVVRDELDALIKAGNVATKPELQAVSDQVALKANQAQVNTINTQLGTKANQTQVTQLANNKMDKVLLNDTQTTNNNIWSAQKVDQMIKAIPKGEKGDPGTANVAINDGAPNASQTWSSKKISDEITPLYNTVYSTVYPVEGSLVYFEKQTDNSILFSFEMLNIRNFLDGDIQFQDLKTTYPDRVVTSSNGTECLKLADRDCLVFNTTTKKAEIVVVKEVVGQPSLGVLKNHIPVLCNFNGEVRLGGLDYDYLSDKIAKNIKLEEVKSDLWYVSGTTQPLYIETDETTWCNYVKWDELIRRANIATRLFDWAKVKADINNNALFVTSPGGVQDCLRVGEFEALVYDTIEDKIKLVNRTIAADTYIDNYSSDRYVCLLFAPWGRMERGVLPEIYTFNNFPELYKNYQFLINLGRGNVLPPAHWRAHMTSKINTINDLQGAGGNNAVSFGMITDMHMGDNAGNSWILLEKVMRECNIPYFINGGDYVTGAGIVGKQGIIDDIKLVFKRFSRILDRQLITFGNHDANYGVNANYDSQLSDGEIYNNIFRENQRRSDIVSGGNGTYYYADDKINKIRYIILNAQDVSTVNNPNNTVKPENNTMYNYVIRQDQFNWLANTALATPDNTWSVVVCSHVSPSRTDPANNGLINGDILMGILGAYKDKKAYNGTSQANVRQDLQVNVTCNFTGKGGNVICVVSGHMHVDTITPTVHGVNINCIETLNDSKSVETGAPAKIVGTNTEQAFDIFTINKDTRTVNITRIGAGADRKFTY